MKIIFTVIAAMLIATSSFASVIYTDIDPDATTTVVTNQVWDGIPLDLNDDGTVDCMFYWAHAMGQWELHMVGGDAIGSSNNELTVSPSANPQEIMAYSMGQEIGPNNTNLATANDPLLSYSSDPIIGGIGDVYIGIHFGAGSVQYYGWVLLAVDGQTLSVQAYAYEDVPSTAITTGDTGSPAVLVQSIAVTGDGGATTIATMGGTLQMNAAVLPVDATNQNVTWSVDNVAIATIDANGLLTAVSNGIVSVTATAQDGSGVEGSQDITISNQDDGLAENELSHLLTLYPNPAVHSLKILNNTEFNIETVRIYSMNGSEVMTIIGMDEFIDVSNLEAGNYHITFELSNGEMTAQKFVKQ